MLMGVPGTVMFLSVTLETWNTWNIVEEYVISYGRVSVNYSPALVITMLINNWGDNGDSDRNNKDIIRLQFRLCH